MIAALLAAALSLSAAASPEALAPGARGRNAPDLRPLPPSHPDDTRCEACHTPDGWSEVAFAHERTGFPLRGAHLRAGCKACHAESFTRALGRTCGSCHRDAHEGRLGARCEACHEESSWRSRFDADAHRRGNFPLVGRHAFLPCEACHGDRRDRGFTRATPGCIACHQKDYDATAGRAVDHRAAGFGTRCQECHGPWRFQGASFAQHEACFPIASGRHAGVACLKCHTSLGSIAATGACSTGTAACMRCHDCGKHPTVAGFACFARKCYECHPGGTTGGSGALRRSGGKTP